MNDKACKKKKSTVGIISQAMCRFLSMRNILDHFHTVSTKMYQTFLPEINFVMGKKLFSFS